MEKASIFSAAGLPLPGLARPPAPACPHPATRAPRAPEGEACARLYPAPAALAGALVAVVCRDIRGLGLTDAQRLSHFCASPLLALSWFQDFEVGVVRERGGQPCWTPYGASVVLSGSQSHPFTSWAPSAGRGGMVCMTADAVRALFGLDPSTLQDRFVPAHGLLGRAWWPFLDALVAAPDDAATLAVLAQHLGPRWQAQAGQQGGMASLRRLGRHWVERLAFQAHQWRLTHSPRQVERRIKAHSGRSLREWQGLLRTESLLFAARDRHAAGQPFDWANLALEHGFSDQAHMIRASRRITGFTPTDFARRYQEDESFWVYRLWV